jgi:FkbM family methyltransferase
MLNLVKGGGKKALSRLIYHYFPKIGYGRDVSYSQIGEDMVLKTFLKGKSKGFYVDVGAHHPFRYSNTAYFYNRGWNGINIEPTPTLLKNFKRYRRRDINLNIGITNQEDELTFYMFNDPAFNSFDNATSLSRHERGNVIVKEQKIRTYRLSCILDKYLPKGKKIDLLSIDVEGFDLDVLKSNNWEKYIPDFICVEIECSIENLYKDEIYNYLVNRHYILVAINRITAIFQRIK